MKVYLNYTQEELDNQYDQMTLVPNHSEYVKKNRNESVKVREKLNCFLNVSYGPTVDEVLDIFPANESGRPIMIFFHGGGWKAGHKDNYSYIAQSFIAKGVNLIIPNFSLAPEVSLDEIVYQCRAVLSWVYHNSSERFDGNMEEIFICGHSSGGHLAGMVLITDWMGEYNLPRNLIKGAILISGMYDLEPVRLSYRNQYLFLDERSSLRNSPIHHIPDISIPTIVGYGDGEHEEFKRQSDDFVGALQAAGNSVRKIIMTNQNHFDVARELSKPDSPIMMTTWSIMSIG